MKKIALLFAVLVAAFSSPVFGDTPKPGSVAAQKKPEVKVTGEVICLSCYMDHNSKGAQHASCAQMCAKNGVPLAILEDKTEHVYPVVMGHEGGNAELVQYAGKRVTLTGHWLQKGQTKVFNFKAVAPAQ